MVWHFMSNPQTYILSPPLVCFLWPDSAGLFLCTHSIGAFQVVTIEFYPVHLLPVPDSFREAHA